MITGRNEDRLREVIGNLSPTTPGQISYLTADGTNPSDVKAMFDQMIADQGRLDVLVNCVGQSDRGLVESLSADRLRELFDQNVMATLFCCQGAIEHLEKTGGVIINIGSLAAKVAPRYLGGYAITKHALAALTSQLRLELKPRGVHVGQINPGPIRRSDAGERYADRVGEGLPGQANQPGAGTRVKGLDPQRVADAVVKMIRRRQPDVILPKHLRFLIAIGHTVPRLGDWLLLKFTSSSS